MKYRGRTVSVGVGVGEALVSQEPISFYGGIDPETGYITEPNHRCFGNCLKDKIFVFPNGKGSTVGSYVIYRMKKLDTAPAAILNRETDAIIATGCVMAGIPLMDQLEFDPVKAIKTGMNVRVNADKSIVELL